MAQNELRKRKPSLTQADKSGVTDAGRAVDQETFFKHQQYEFGGPWGTAAMVVVFPVLMYYFYICLAKYDGKFTYPESTSDIVPWLERMGQHIVQDAYPTRNAWVIYGGLMALQLALAFVMPGPVQKGLPVPSLDYKALDYHCNALSSFYATLAIAAGLHLSGIWRLTEIVDNFGPLMTVSMIVGFAISFVVYFLTIFFGEPIRMSGNFFYDFFMGACLNPRFGSVDLKMFAEVRIPWVLLFGIAVSAACKQYEQYGYLTPNLAFMVLATGLYINACAKGEECIPQTWDMSFEKWGFMIIFWNFSGVPFTYCYPIIYLINNPPETYRFSTIGYIGLYGLLLLSYYCFDTSMSQKSRFKMQMQGVYVPRWTFPQLPWGTLENPTYIKTKHGNCLLTSGWWGVVRKPNYTADWIQAATWGLSTGFHSTPIAHWYTVWFFIVLTHRCSRDFERCSVKYGEDWKTYCSIVKYRFIPYIY